jgi:hypothetical protein
MDVRASVDSKKARDFVATKYAHSRLLVKQVFDLLVDRLRNATPILSNQSWGSGTIVCHTDSEATQPHCFRQSNAMLNLVETACPLQCNKTRDSPNHVQNGQEEHHHRSGNPHCEPISEKCCAS